jgi:predicted DNA-binding protein (UPF0251 family)
MPRKRCCGQVDEYPVSCRFVSSQNESNETVSLGVEEVEAVRLKDMAGRDQKECAREMGLTRPTFQRILAAARKKIATALAEGKTIVIEGGHFIMKNRIFECLDCGEKWEEAPCTEGGKHGHEIACPKCGSMNKAKVVEGERRACGSHGGHEHGEDCGCGHHEDHEHGEDCGCGNHEGRGCCGDK